MFSTAIQRLNDRRHAAGEVGEDAGFTLIELMVVLLILAILLAIAIPTFLGVTKSANDRAAQSNLNTALINAKAAYQTGGQSYGTGTAAVNTAAMVTALGTAEPALSFTSGASTAQNIVSVYASADGQGIVLAGLGKSTNDCFYEIDSANTEAIAVTAPVNPYTVFATWNITINSGTASTAWSAGPVPAGTFYGESKNVAANGCNAQIPTAAGAGTAIYNTGYPSL
jgi:type IV pilus assembly protein PilA